MPKLLTLPRGGRGGFGLGGITGDDIISASSGTPARPAPFDFGKVVQGGVDFYTAKTQLDMAKYGSALAKAQAQAAVNIAKAGGQAAATTAGVGFPSPSLLLVSAIGLAALLLLRK